jgi:hypothetical protein
VTIPCSIAAPNSGRIERSMIPLSRVPKGQLWCMNALRGIWPAILI